MLNELSSETQARHTWFGLVFMTRVGGAFVFFFKRKIPTRMRMNTWTRYLMICYSLRCTHKHHQTRVQEVKIHLSGSHLSSVQGPLVGCLIYRRYRG